MNCKLAFNVVCASLLMAAAACSDDNNKGVDGTGSTESVNLYMSVKIKDSSSMSRAGETTFEYGTASEGKVSSADFWFYDAEGYYVAKAEVWGDGTSSTGDPAGNIEFESNTVIVLNNLNNKSYPKYMVTALNFPASFTPATTLTELASQLTDLATAGGTMTEQGAFLMTTSSYSNGVSVGGQYMPFVNELSDDNFVSVNTHIDEVEAVDVYVERLAVKVRVTIDGTLANTYVDGKGYPLGITIAGKDNDDPDNNSVGDTQIYIDLLAWGLNITAKNTLLVKDIDTSWTDIGLGFMWNSNDYHRSFWGKSYNYGKDEIQGYGGSDYLRYSTFTGIKNTFENVDYCAENTNTVAKLNDNDYTALCTSVLIAAKIVDSEGNDLDLVRYNGVLFTYDAFKAYILNRVNPNIYTKDGDTYTQIGEDDCVIAGKNTGVYVVLNLNGSETYYSKNGETFTELPDISPTAGLCNDRFKQYVGIAYAGGKMYYNIPLTHLNTTNSSENIAEGEYGVVRNHIYSININALETIGMGVFKPGKHDYYDPDDTDEPDDPDEPIIPTPDVPSYYKVGADINILSWRVVNINASL